MPRKKTDKPKTAGRPRKERDPAAARMVKSMAQRFIPQIDICQALREAGFDIGINTLEREYRAELDAGYAIARAKLHQTAFELAVDQKDRAMLCFLLKTKCGLRETERVEMTSPDGSMSPKAGTTFDLSGMTPEEITNIARAAFTGK